MFDNSTSASKADNSTAEIEPEPNLKGNSSSKKKMKQQKNFKEVITPTKLNIKQVSFFSVNPKSVKTTQTLPPHNKSSVSPRQNSHVNNVSESEKAKVGRWSEETVYQVLRNRYETIYNCKAKITNEGFSLKGVHIRKKKEVSLEVKWMNKQDEQGKPFDLKILKNNVEKFIEVKGTSSNDKYSFEITANEIDLMKTNGANFYIFRVFNAGKQNVRIEKLKNIQQEIDKGNITLTPEIYNLQYKSK
jgi:hypothetical protein